MRRGFTVDEADVVFHGRPGNCIATQGVGRPGASEAGVAAVQFRCGRGVQLRSGLGGPTGRVHGESSPIPVAARRFGRIRASRDERVSPATPQPVRSNVAANSDQILEPSPAIKLIVTASTTAPSRYDSSAWRSTVALMELKQISVSETWKVIPTV